MCDALAAALDSMTDVDRKVLAAAAADGAGSSGWLHRVLDGLATQSRVDEMHRAQIVADFERDFRQDIEDLALYATWPDPQVVEGEAWYPDVD